MFKIGSKVTYKPFPDEVFRVIGYGANDVHSNTEYVVSNADGAYFYAMEYELAPAEVVPLPSYPSAADDPVLDAVNNGTVKHVAYVAQITQDVEVWEHDTLENIRKYGGRVIVGRCLDDTHMPFSLYWLRAGDLCRLVPFYSEREAEQFVEDQMQGEFCNAVHDTARKFAAEVLLASGYKLPRRALDILIAAARGELRLTSAAVAAAQTRLDDAATRLQNLYDLAQEKA